MTKTAYIGAEIHDGFTLFSDKVLVVDDDVRFEFEYNVVFVATVSVAVVV